MQWTPPSKDQVAWVAGQLGSSRVRWSRRLLGGTHALTDVLDTDGASVVLRRFDRGDDAVAREQRVLRVLDGLGGLAPTLLAADPDGSLTGQPAIVTDMLAGASTVFPADPVRAAGELGRALAAIHARPRPATLPVLFPPAGGTGADAGLRDGWSAAALAPQVLSHRDFWTGNTLWADERLTGVVDWSGAGRAPRGVDLSWARLDLVLLHGESAADALTAAYERSAGVGVPQMGWWDRYAAAAAVDHVEEWAPNYQDLGRLDLDGAALRRRLEEWLVRLGRR